MSCFARSLVRSALCCLRGVLSLSAWDATSDRARVYSPLWPACWLDCPDRSRRSPSHAVQNIRDVYIQEVGFVPRVREKLFTACNSPDVDASWLLWSREAEASLARAYLSAGGPPLPFRILAVMWVEANFPSAPFDFIVALYAPWFRHLESLVDISPQLCADNLKCTSYDVGSVLAAAQYIVS